MHTRQSRFGRHALSVAAGAAIASTVLAGCGGSDTGPQQDPPSSASAQSQAAQHSGKPLTGKSTPTRVQIPKLKVDASVEKVGLAEDGTVETPALNEPNMTGWYKNGPTPGEKGPSVILGHVDTAKNGPSVFFKLRRMKTGDKITVKREDGSSATFAVRKKQDVSKQTFPTKKVYGDISFAGLRLITCGGKFDQQKKSYEDNLIVYAKLVSTTKA